MHLVAITSFLVAAVALCHAQGTAIVNAVDHWCGQWAGALDIADAIPDQLLPGTYPSDKKLFIEPQLQRVPFSPVMGPEERIQVPKLWGNHNFRLALLSYADPSRVYASSKSRWADFASAFNHLKQTCVVGEGTGGAYLVPPSPGLTAPTLVVYAYAVGSYLDFHMNYYMSTPSPLNPATLQNQYVAADGNFTIPPPTPSAPVVPVDQD